MLILKLSLMRCLYPWMEVQLVGVVTDVQKNNSNKLLITIVIGPMSRASRHSEEVTGAYVADLLMAVSELLRRLLRFLVCFRAARKYNSLQPSPC